MRNYTAELYKKLVEDINDKTYQRFMKDEQDFIASIPNIKSRTVIDLGAGYGRVVPFLANIAHDVVAIELNPNMYSELERRASGLTNVKAVQGDFLKLDAILPETVRHPIFLILQNTLGTIENGDSIYALSVLVEEAKKRQGELVLGLFRQPALRSWGISLYAKEADMVGNIDLAKTDFDRGLMVTDTGYTSKWWSDDDLAKLRDSGDVVKEALAEEYALFQVSFRNDH